MESHHDTTRNQTEKLVVALEEKLINLEKLIKQIPAKLASTGPWSVHANDNVGKVLLVPEGLGGRKVGDYTLVSTASPLGKKLIK